MVDLDDLFSRADVIDGCIEPLASRIIHRLLGQPVTGVRGQQAALAIRSRAEMLDDAGIRADLFKLLREQEASRLCDHLGVDCDRQEPWSTLLGLKFGSVRRRRLLQSFFSVEADEVEEATTADEGGVVRPGYGLFGHQRDVAAQAESILWSASKVADRRVVMHMPTGAGKTRTAMTVVCNRLRTENNIVLWVADKNELCMQAAAEFRKAWGHLGNRELELIPAWGNGDALVSALGSSGAAEEHALFIVTTIQTLVSVEGRPGFPLRQLGQRVSLTVFDEAHLASAPQYKLAVEAVVSSNPSGALLGLTATPGRTYNNPERDRELVETFGRNKATMTVEGYNSPVEFLIDQGYLAKPTFTSMETDLDCVDERMLQELGGGKLSTQSVQHLAEDLKRNMLLLKVIDDACTRHRRFILFAANVEHAKAVTQVLSVKGLAARVITGETNSAPRAEAIAWYKEESTEVRILVNFAVLMAGFDAPATTACIIARPTDSLVAYSQMIGRAMRGVRAGGNDSCEIFTLVDFDRPGFSKPSEMFLNWEDVWQN